MDEPIFICCFFLLIKIKAVQDHCSYVIFLRNCQACKSRTVLPQPIKNGRYDAYPSIEMLADCLVIVRVKTCYPIIHVPNKLQMGHLFC